MDVPASKHMCHGTLCREVGGQLVGISSLLYQESLGIKLGSSGLVALSIAPVEAKFVLVPQPVIMAG